MLTSAASKGWANFLLKKKSKLGISRVRRHHPDLDLNILREEAKNEERKEIAKDEKKFHKEDVIESMFKGSNAFKEHYSQVSIGKDTPMKDAKTGKSLQ